MLFNTERKTETLRVLVLLLLLTLSCRGQSQLIGSSQPIVAALGDDIILPCLLVPAEDASGLTLEWARPDLNPRFVHLWRSGVELMTKKHQSFKGRTSLFIDELKVGNISLKLSNVTVADRGTYKCFLPGLDRQTLVQLVVGAASPPVLTLSGMDRDKGGVVLDCESRGWYPEPEVLWLDAEGNLLSAGPTETVRGPDDLYTVSSRVTVERHSNSFTCRVHQKSTTQTRDAHITVPEDFFKVPPSSVPIITGLAVSLALSLTGCFLLVLLLLFVVWRWRTTRTKNKAEDEPVTEGRERERGREREQLMKEMKDNGLKKSRHKKEETRREEARREEAEKEVQALKEELETKKKELETKQTEMENLEEEKKKNETEMQKMKEELENKNKELVTAPQKQGRSFFSFMSRSEREQEQEVETLKEKMETQQKKEMETLKEKMETQQKESNMKIKKLEDQQQTVNTQWMNTNEELKETKLQLETKEKELVTAPQKQGRGLFSLRGRSEEEQQQEMEKLKEEMEKLKEKMETQQKEEMEKLKEEMETLKEKMETQQKEEMETLKEKMETQQKESNMKIKELEDQQQTANTQWMKTNEELKETKLQLETKRGESSQLKRELDKLLFDEQKKNEKADKDMKEQLFIEQKKKEKAHKDMKTLVEEIMEREKKLNEETRRRRQAEREVETLKEELDTKVSSLRPHQEDSSSANHNSTPGSVFVIDVDQQGKYICVRNTSYEEQHLGGWRLEMQIKERKPICYSFNESLKLKSRETVSMRGKGCGILSPSDTWWKEFRSFNSEDKLKFTLINISTDKRYDLNSYLVNN